MSFSITNDRASSTSLKSIASASKISTQANYTVITGTSYEVKSDEVFLIVSVSTVTTPATHTTLTLPSAASSAGRDLIIVNRANTNTNLLKSSISNIVDIENDPNVASPTTQADILPCVTGGTWVHLVSDGRNWVAVAKNVAAP
jgi:hypothetical protein